MMTAITTNTNELRITLKEKVFENAMEHFVGTCINQMDEETLNINLADYCNKHYPEENPAMAILKESEQFISIEDTKMLYDNYGVETFDVVYEVIRDTLRNNETLRYLLMKLGERLNRQIIDRLEADDKLFLFV